MNRKVIIFDFDGTIADILPIIYKYGPDFSEEFSNKKLTLKEIDDLRGNTIKEIIKKLKVPFIKLPIMLIKAKGIFTKEMNHIQLVDGIKKVLQELKKRGYSLGILSSNSMENLNEFLEKNRLLLFDFIHSEFNIFGKDKALKNLLKKYDIKLKNVIYIGDEVRDIEACKKDNIQVIAVTWGLNTKEILKKYHPTHLVDKPSEILEILK